MTELEWLDIFSNNLIDILKDQRMTQRDLADAAGLSEGMVSSIINKQKMPGIKTIINMSHALDIDVDELVDFGSMII